MNRTRKTICGPHTEEGARFHALIVLLGASYRDIGSRTKTCHQSWPPICYGRLLSPEMQRLFERAYRLPSIGAWYLQGTMSVELQQAIAEKAGIPVEEVPPRMTILLGRYLAEVPSTDAEVPTGDTEPAPATVPTSDLGTSGAPIDAPVTVDSDATTATT